MNVLRTNYSPEKELKLFQKNFLGDFSLQTGPEPAVITAPPSKIFNVSGGNMTLIF
jgi:hypothetical protein